MNYLFMVMMGCRPAGRHTEQHDIFFGIGKEIGDLIPKMKAFWPEAKGKFHLDAWRRITRIDGWQIEVVPKEPLERKQFHSKKLPSLFFINLGGYKPGIFDEFHYKQLVVAQTKTQAIQQAKTTAFFQHTGFKGAAAHIDDKYGIDVDDLMEIKEALPESDVLNYRLRILKAKLDHPEDPLYIGYFKLSGLARTEI